jgi:hypothetical protein
MKANKKILTYAGIVAFLIVLAYSFVPQVLTGKIVNQSDISGFVGMAHEAKTWDAAHPDDKTAWTNSMFGGMPTTMITGHKEGDATQWLYSLMLKGKRPASYLFISLIGAFLLMLSLGINGLIAAGGAVAVTFCSYNFQIIQVGHNSKMLALAFLPWVLAAAIFTYKSALGGYKKAVVKKGWKSWLPKTLLGAALFAMALNFQIKANHIQITYYLAIILFSYVIVLIIWILANKENRSLAGRFAIASAMLLVLGILGIGANANKLITTYDYTQHTMRGGSELVSEDGKSKSAGLDLEYATAWSYGWEELPNMMIPDYNGGSSAGAVNPDKSATIKLLKEAGQPNIKGVAKSLPLYWGPQPFTAGPMYMGAITVFLFVLGLLLYRGKEKWWLSVPTIIAILLAVGNHFMPFTEFWYNHIPFYNKFRTVSMALVVLQFTLPMLGFIVLDKIVKSEYDEKSFMKAGLTALALTVGFCLISMTGLGRTFTGEADSGQQDILVKALIADRKMLLRQDALMATVFICITFLLLWWSYRTKDSEAAKGRKVIAGVAISCLVIVNMFAIGKRYLNSDHFVPQRSFDAQFNARPVDKAILEDKDLSYRVIDLTTNIFNDSHPSYFHKNIGGYSPAKLQRYQDLIEHYLAPEINGLYGALRGAKAVEDLQTSLPYLPMLSMLNDKYIIVGEDIPPVVNQNAFGNCWLVDSVAFAGTAKEEIDMIGKVDLRRTAVVSEDIKDLQKYSHTSFAASVTDTIYLTGYTPKELKYSYKADTERLVVFSEIYYPYGWEAVLDDGSPVELFGANWILRAALLPAGEHELTMTFSPKSYKLGADISRASSILLILFLLLGLAASFGCDYAGSRLKSNSK